MIHYQLRCAAGHEFEGWFKGSDSFEAQARHGLLSCPRCGMTEVNRGLMAPAVQTRPMSPTGKARAAKEVPGAALPDEMRVALQRIRAEVERNCEDMGDGFADEALRISRGEAEERGIYGNASEEDRGALADEGIAVVQIPWLKPAES